MQLLLDLHIHSRYAKATSKNTTIPELVKWAKYKGINVLGTGDFTHPLWFNEIKHLHEKDGLLFYDDFPFILSVEVNNKFEYQNRILQIHNVILTDSIDGAKQIIDAFSKYGDLNEDGRPTLNLSMMEMIDILKSLSFKNEVFPAHIWTPWYSILGERNGLNNINEVIDDRIIAVETGLSSDPTMNWITHVRKFPIISNSDAHSPRNLGREATLIEPKNLSYDSIIDGIRNGIVKTYEYYPQEGKYYYNGHRNCNYYSADKEICPVCNRKLTIGVLNRVLKLADKQLGYKPENAKPFSYKIPLDQIISKVYNKDINSKFVLDLYLAAINFFGNENNFYQASDESIKQFFKEKSIEVIKIRNGEIYWRPGYDGVFGEFFYQSIENKKYKTLFDI